MPCIVSELQLLDNVIIVRYAPAFQIYYWRNVLLCSLQIIKNTVIGLRLKALVMDGIYIAQLAISAFIKLFKIGIESRTMFT